MTDQQQVLATGTVIAFYNNKNIAFLRNANSISSSSRAKIIVITWQSTATVITVTIAPQSNQVKS